jgi:hypothetical protein
MYRSIAAGHARAQALAKIDRSSNPSTRLDSVRPKTEQVRMRIAHETCSSSVQR